MKRSIELAKMGLGSVAPNPLVGCVIVCDDKIIGEGFHQTFGAAHAEVNALENIKNDSLLSNSTLYVNLEPCAHHGKTPPCADLIISKKLKRVVIGCLDINPLVAGNGIQKLRESGIEVIENVLEEMCLHLNRRFFIFHNKKRPYIILKWAQSKDGFMDKKRGVDEKGVNWITTAASQRLAHRWRSQEQAILVGNTTLKNDNPSLTVRHVLGKNPIRIVISPNLDFDMDSAIVGQEASTFLFYNKREETEIKKNNLIAKNSELKFFELADENILTDILDCLYTENIQSIIVEGGAFSLNQFLLQGLWDEARVFVGYTNFNEGLEAPKCAGSLTESYFSDSDEVQIFYNA